MRDFRTIDDVRAAYPKLVEQLEKEVREEAHREVLARRVRRIERGLKQIQEDRKPRIKVDRRTESLVCDVLEEAQRSGRDPKRILEDYRDMQKLREIFDAL